MARLTYRVNGEYHLYPETTIRQAEEALGRFEDENEAQAPVCIMKTERILSTIAEDRYSEAAECETCLNHHKCWKDGNADGDWKIIDGQIWCWGYRRRDDERE
jgi:hypothetical protein